MPRVKSSVLVLSTGASCVFLCVKSSGVADSRVAEAMPVSNGDTGTLSYLHTRTPGHSTHTTYLPGDGQSLLQRHSTGTFSHPHMRTLTPLTPDLSTHATCLPLRLVLCTGGEAGGPQGARGCCTERRPQAHQEGGIWAPMPAPPSTTLYDELHEAMGDIDQ